MGNIIRFWGGKRSASQEQRAHLGKILFVGPHEIFPLNEDHWKSNNVSESFLKNCGYQLAANTQELKA